MNAMGFFRICNYIFGIIHCREIIKNLYRIRRW